MLEKLMTVCFNRYFKRLNKEGLQNMVDAYDLCNYIDYTVKPHMY